LDVALGEECDEGDLMPSATCRNCTIVECGDMVVDIGEECDDGKNGDDTDGCRDDCTIPYCGDNRYVVERTSTSVIDDLVSFLFAHVLFRASFHIFLASVTERTPCWEKNATTA